MAGLVLGHIGARKGSKGVPRKNFREICGKPLIDWSLDQLFAHPAVDAVVVSTDDEEIYDHAVAKGARIMVCGGRDMGAGVRATLTEILSPLTIDALAKEGRYAEDVY